MSDGLLDGDRIRAHLAEIGRRSRARTRFRKDRGRPVDVLLGQLLEAGLQPERPEPLGPPGAALRAVTAVR